MLSPPRRQSHQNSRPSSSSGLKSRGDDRASSRTQSPQPVNSSSLATYSYSFEPSSQSHHHLTKHKFSMSASSPSSNLSENSNGGGVRGWRATKLFESVRRSVSSSRKVSELNTPEPGMYSTPAERFAPPRHSNAYGSHRDRDPASIRPPSIAQIAVGLHTSRTPHLPPHRGRAPSRNNNLYVHDHYGHFPTKSEPDRENGTSTPLTYSSRPSSSHSLSKSHLNGSTPSIQPLTPLRPSLKKPITSPSTPANSITQDRSTSPSLTMSASTLASSTSAPRTPLHSPAWLSRLLQKSKTVPSSRAGSTTSLPSIVEQHRKVVRFKHGDGDDDEAGDVRKESVDTVKIAQPSPRRLEPRLTFD